MNDLKQQILSKLYKDGKLNLIQLRKYKDLKNELKKYNEQNSIAQNVYDILFQPKICFCYCGNKVRFLSLQLGYSSSCCIQHAKNNPITLERRKQTSLKKYGVENVSSHPTIKKKRKETNLKNYGVECNLARKDIIENKRQTWLNKYGVINPSQNEEIFNKQQSSLKRIKEDHFPSGIKYKYQGYENIAINKLLEAYNENDIIIRKNLPKILYENNNRLARYFPDIYIPSKKLIIEVKSNYTYYNEKWFNLNQKKAQACINQNFNFEFWICNEKEVLEIIIPNTS